MQAELRGETMSEQTDELKLFKYDGVDDADNTFNIDTGLNDNWEKIDEFAKKQRLSGLYYKAIEEVTIDIPETYLDL